MTLIRWLARSLVGDDSFGPAVGGFFDLTLRFQDTVFAMPLALWIILATPAYITRAIRKKPCTDSGLLLRGKATVVTAVIVFELVSLILNVTNESLQSVVSTAAAILSFGASIAIAIVLYVEHMYSLKTSTFLSIYLAIAALFDIVRARSYFIRPDLGAIGGISVALVILKLVLVALEEVSKARLIKSEYLRKPLGKEFISGFWNRSLFIWLNSTLIMGFKKDITINELPDPGPEFDSEHLHERFEPNWEKGNNSSKFKLALAGAQTLCWEFVSVFIPRACCIGFRMAQPFLVWRIIVAVGDRDTSVSTIGGLLGATFIVYAGIALTNVYYEHLNCRMTTFVRAILITAIFRKSLKLPYDDLKNASALTLMSTDVSGVERLFPLFHDTWSGLAELGIGLYILSTTVGAAAFLTLIPIFIMTVISSYAAKKMGVARAGWNEKIENRIAATSNILAQLKSLKMTGLTTLATKSLQKKRFEEIGYSSKERWLRAVLHMLQAVAEGMTPVVVLAGGFFWTRSSTGLGAADIFKTLSVIAIVSGPLSRVLVCMPFLVGSMACLGRIQKYLLLEELVDTRIIDHDNDATLDTVIKEKPVGGVWAKSKCAMELEAATLSVPSIDRPLIKNAHMKDRRRGNVTMIYGPVGCGKSTLLKAIIGEVGLQSGRVRLGSGQVAYCDQTPWLQNCSIRDNIIAQTEYIADRYNDVLYCCALDEDMKQFSDGDKTIIGSRGSTLSGGQKQRVALARAIYACAPLLVLDDAISALDLATAKAILTRVFRKNSTVRMFDTSVVMTTNILEHLPLADVVFSINQTGELQQEPNVKNFVRDTAAQLAGQPEDNVPRTGENRKSEPVSELPSADVPEASELDNYNWVRRNGDMSLYTYYLKEMGWSRVALWVFLTAVTGAGEKIPQIFLRIWYDTNPTNYAYFGGFAALSAAYVLLTVVMVLYYYLVLAPAASNGLHSNLLKTVKGSTFSFICETDIGSILSRFSQDMTLVAQMLPISLLEVVFILCIALVSLGIISAGSSYAAAIIPIFAIVLYFVQYFYLRTSRQMRLLELEANALLFTLFSETSDGMQHIRAFQWQSNYMWQCHGMLDYSQKPYYYMFCIQRWLTLVLELSTCFIAVALVSLALFFTNSTSETAIGLAMINLITFSQLLNDLIAAWVELEASLGAIARTRDFNRTTPQEKPVDRLPKAKLPDYWPTEGGIEFANVNARYRSTGERSQQILNEINFKVQPGQKIAVTGRTGSGKSSLILSLLNLMVHSGTIAIDGTDIKTVDKDFLRSRITTVPQDGIELAASVRVNLDPYDDPKLTHRLFDDTLEDILARVGLQDIIKARGGLDASLKSMALSPGQKQLLCLARAILVREYTRSRIVLIDEATSNVDLETEKRLQSIMAKEFANCTVITVTHRDDGVEFADIVVEMADGRIIKTVDRRAKKDSQTKDFEDGGNAVAKPEMHNIEAQNKSEP